MSENTPPEDSELDERENGGFCPKCGGSGDSSDGLLVCEHCDGEGHEWWQ
jgi:DnaJ-class molecular chaperone